MPRQTSSGGKSAQLALREAALKPQRDGQRCAGTGRLTRVSGLTVEIKGDSVELAPVHDPIRACQLARLLLELGAN
jgi:hypothetical protein